MAEYTNPEGMYQNVNPIPQNPFMSGWMGAGNQMAATPALQRQNESGQMDLLRKQMETGEFMSPEAQQMRSTARQAETAKNRHTIQVTPEQIKNDIQKLQEDQKVRPEETLAKIEQAKQLRNHLAGGPYEQFFGEFGNLYPQLRELKGNPGGQAEHINRFIERWHQKNPLMAIPEEFRNISSENALGHVMDSMAVHASGMGDPKFLQQVALKTMDNQSHLGGIEMQGQTARDVAGIQGRAHVEGARLQLSASETPTKAEARLRKELRADPNNDEARRELTGYLEEKFDNKFQKDPRGQLLAVQAASSPEAAKSYEVYKNQQKARLFIAEGLYGDIDQSGYDWALRAIAANPNTSVSAVIENGKKMGKIGTKKPQMQMPQEQPQAPQPQAQPQAAPMPPQAPQPQGPQTQTVQPNGMGFGGGGAKRPLWISNDPSAIRR